MESMHDRYNRSSSDGKKKAIRRREWDGGMGGVKTGLGTCTCTEHRRYLLSIGCKTNGRSNGDNSYYANALGAGCRRRQDIEDTT